MALSDKQLETAAIITRVGNDVGASKEQITAAISGAWIESRLGALDGGDKGTAWGIFQQRNVAGWGTKERVSDPYNAARDFFLGYGGHKGLLDTWNTRTTHGLDVQAVQNSAHPYRYDGAMSFARTVVSQLEDLLNTDISESSTPARDPTYTGGGAGGTFGVQSNADPTSVPAPPDLTQPTKQTSNLQKFVLIGVGLLLIFLAVMRLSN